MAQPRDTESTPKGPDTERDLDRDNTSMNPESENIQGRADEEDEDEFEEVEEEEEEEGAEDEEKA